LKKIVAIGVLIAFMLNTMGLFVIFRYNRFLIRQEMIAFIRSGASNDNIAILKIVHPERNKNFRRTEKNEFSFYAKLYDVVTEGKNGDTTVFYCLHDKKEEDLISKYAAIGSIHNSSCKDNTVLALLHNLINQALILQTFIPEVGHATAFLYPVSNSEILPVYLVHIGPPPKSA